MMRLRGKMNASKVTATLRKIADKFPDRVGAAIYQEAQIEVTEMKRRCPVDTTAHAPHPGNLRASIHAEEPVRKGRRISVTVATGVQAPYAIYVHEDLDAIHPIGEAKFMESVIKESAPSMLDRIGKRVQLNEK